MNHDIKLQDPSQWC